MLKKITMALLFMCLYMTQVSAQSSNPRGVYKRVAIGINGETVKDSSDTYKICTDTITLMVYVADDVFTIIQHDDVLNYTGQSVDENDSCKTRVYDSDSTQFTEMWKNDIFGVAFVAQGWCTEYYKAGAYTDKGRIIMDFLMNPACSQTSAPLYGIWKNVGNFSQMEDLKNAFESGDALADENAKLLSMFIFRPNYMVCLAVGENMTVNGVVEEMELPGDGQNCCLWLAADYIVVGSGIEETPFSLLKRVTDKQCVLNIISPYVDRVKYQNQVQHSSTSR